MKLTACSIVKNEEKNIAKSIESYKKAVDEIIIVDTGSTDNTVEICKKLGAKVLHYEWDNDFSAAKNFALDYATGDWIFFLDADEWFVPNLVDDRMKNILIELESKHHCKAVRTVLCNIDETTQVVRSKTEVMRIFKRDENIRYVGRVHEKVLENNNNIVSAKLNDLEIYHSGYSDTVIKQKTQRNLDMLYNLYRKGKAGTDTYFYLARENYIGHNWDEFVKFYELFNNQPDKDELIAGTNVFVSIYEFGINYKFITRDKYTLEEIKQEIDVAIEKYPQIPIHYYYNGMYYAQFDYKKAIMNLEYALELHDTYEEFYIDTFGSLVTKTYLELAKLYKVSYLYDKAFDYLLLVLKNEPFNAEGFKEMLEFIRGQQDEDIILFLNQLYDIKDKEQVGFLAKQFMYSRCHKIFLYYAMKFNKEFEGQDETTYMAMILSHNEKIAIETALTAYSNARSEDDRFFAALALLKDKQVELFEEIRPQLHLAYANIINNYLKEEKIEATSQEEIHAFKHLYGHMFYIASQQEIQQMENLFEQLPEEVVINIIQCELQAKNYHELIQKLNEFKNIEYLQCITAQLDKTHAFAAYFIKDYGQCLTYFEKALKAKNIDIDKNIILYLKVLTKLEDNEVISTRAARLYNKYAPIFEEYVVVKDMLTTEKIKKINTEYDSIDIKTLTQDKFIQIIQPAQEKLPDEIVKSLFNLMETYIEREMSVEAHPILLRLLKNEYREDIVYYRLGEIYTKLENPALSFYCHKKVFEENATFAETLIQDATQSKRNYIYQEIEHTEIETCPLCGGHAELQAVFNTLPSSDFTEEFSPIKTWRYCTSCHHKFASWQPKELSFEIEKEKAKEEIEQMPNQIIQYEDSIRLINRYVESGNMLDIGSGNGAFMAAAMEYGFNIKGIEPIEELAQKTSKVLDASIDACTFEDYTGEEKYDVISMTGTLENMMQPTQSLKKIHHMLNENGILYIETPNFDSGFARVKKDKCGTLRLTKILHYFSRKSLEKLLADYNFEIVSYQMSKRNNGCMEVIAKRK